MVARWYVVHVHSTFENKVAEYIREQASLKGVSDKFKEIFVPSQEVIDVKSGKKVSRQKCLYPGYILVCMEMVDAAWHLVSSNSKVTGFLGSGARPSPISEKEVKRLMQQIEENVNNPQSAINFEVNEEVRIIDGPFMSFNAIVDEIDVDKARLKVTVKIFERNTPVDLDFKQVEKL